MKKLLFTQLLLLVTVVWGFAQTTVTLTSSKDNTIFESATGTLSSGIGGEVIVGRTGNTTGGLIRRAFMQFDVSSIPTNATITSVSLKLQMTKTSSGTKPVGLHKATSDWGEGTSNSGTGNGSGSGATATMNDATWIHTFSPSSSWTNAGGDYVSTASATLSVNGTGSYTWASTASLVADVQSWITNSATNFGWAIVGDETSVKTTKHFVTKEGTNAAFRPELSITYTVPAPPNIVISEINYNAPGTDTLEYLELYNNGSSAVNLNGWSIVEGVSYTFPNITINAGDYLLVAVDSIAMQNAYGVTAYEWTSGALGNSGEDITIVDANGITIDSVDYEDNTNGWDTHPDGNGSSLVLCDVNADNNDAANWSRAYTDAGFAIVGLQVYGSPGAANNCTAPVITYPLANIGAINNVDATTGVADSIGNNYEIRGVVYGVDLDGNTGLSFTIIDPTGGINVFNGNDVDNYVVTEGDSIHMTGTVGQFNGLTQFSPVSIALISQGNAINMPTVVTTLDESTESQLVRINGLTIVSGWATSGSFNAIATDGANNFTIRVDSDVNVSGTAAPVGTFDIIGLGGQFDNSNPYLGGYQILPRYTADVITTAPVTPVVSFSSASATISEGAGTATVDVTIVNPSMMATTVDVMLDVAGSTATNGSDFSYTSPMTVTFPANSTTTQSVTITITDDMMTESDETIVLNLMNPTMGVTVGAISTHTITINDNDAIVPTNPVYTIGMVNTEDATTGVADSLNVTCELRGVVYGVDLDGNAGISFTMIDPTGGINVFNFNDIDNYVVTEGDSIHVVGTIGQFNGLTQIQPTSIALISQGNTINMPTVVTALDETTEAQLVRINGLTIVSGWNTSGSFNAIATDGTNNYTIRIDSDVNVSGTAAPVGTFDVVGLGGQFDNSNPYTSGYQILPRYTADIIPVVVTVPTVEFATSAATVNESAGAVTVDVTLVNPTMTATTVDVMLDAANSTASNGSDFTYTSPTTVTFPANSTTTQSVTITITDDMMVESNETIVLNLMNATTGVTIGGTATHTITINDNDATIPNIVINEIHYNQPSTDSLEYIELYNNSGSAADLQGWTFTQGVTHTFPAITLAAGDYLVLALDSVAMQNAYGVAAYQWTSGALSNGGEDIVLRTANGMEVDSVIYDDGGAWPTLADGFGYGLELCDPNTDNLDPANWNTGATPLNVTISGTDMFGTPGSANVCTVPLANPYPLRSIEEMTMVDVDGLADSLNQGCELRGVVYGIDFDGDAGMSFTMIGAGYGINVFNFNDVDNYVVNEGDSIHVKGTIAQFNGLLEIIPDSITLEGTETINAPTIVTMLDESTESQFVKIEAVTLVDATQWTGAGSGFNVDVRNGTDTLTLRIDNDCDLFTEPAPSGWFNVTGLGGQFDNSNPYTSGYQLFPRNQGDIELLINTNEPQNLAGQIKLFPNPTSGFLNIISEVNLTMVRITNVLGQEVMNVNTPNAQTALDVSHLANGVYVITFMTEAGIWSEQFVKK